MSREEDIREQAKKIMTEFMKALDKVKEVKGEVGFESEHNTRSSDKPIVDADFKKRFLKNAPKRKDDSIVAEKKKW